MSFLNLEGKVFVVFGVANRRSVAYHIARILEEGESAADIAGDIATPEPVNIPEASNGHDPATATAAAAPVLTPAPVVFR